MARRIYSTILLVFLFIARLSTVTCIVDYLPLITDVHNYYGSTSIMMVYPDSFADFSGMTLMNAWTRKLSHAGFLSSTIPFSQLPDRMKEYKQKMGRPLFVVFLATYENMIDFSRATQNMHISYPVWLTLFLLAPGDPLKATCLEPTENIFNLVFSTEMIVACYDHPILREWYALQDNRTRTFDLATWEPGKGMIIRTNDSHYARRTNLFGETLRIAYVRESPLVSVKDGVLTKLFGEVVMELQKLMNFKMEVLDPLEDYGNWNVEQCSWTGVIGLLHRNGADVGVSEFTITTHRMEAVDFTLPLMRTHMKLFLQEPTGSSVKWSAYFKAFHKNIWMMLIFVIVISPIVLTIMKTRESIVIRIMVENYIHVWGIYCQQGLAELPAESSMRVAVLSIFVSALIVSAAYSASLVSFLTITASNLPFSTVAGFANDGRYKLIAFRNSADYDMLINYNDTTSITLRKLLKKKEHLPLTFTEGFHQVCTENVAFYASQQVKEAINRYLPCKILSVRTGRADSLGLILRKDSPYAGLIDYHLQRFKDNGMFRRLKKKYAVPAPLSESDHVAVDFTSITPILAVLLGGIGLAWLILAFERVFYYYYDGKDTDDRVARKSVDLVQTKLHNGKANAGRRRTNPKMRKTSNLSHERSPLGYWP